MKWEQMGLPGSGPVSLGELYSSAPAGAWNSVATFANWAIGTNGLPTVNPKTPSAALGQQFGGSLLGAVSFGGAKALPTNEMAIPATKAPMIPGEYLITGKAPNLGAPFEVKGGIYANSRGVIQPWTAHYDAFGRNIARTDYNAGNKADGIPDIHYHTYEWRRGVDHGLVLDHIPGEYKGVGDGYFQ